MDSECLCVVRCAEAARPDVEQRLEALSRFYLPLGFTHSELRFAGETVVALRLHGASSRNNNEGRFRRFHPMPVWRWIWGEPPAEMLDALSKADDAQLRTLDGSTLIIDGADDALILATGAGATTLYEASTAKVQAWSSHAVAASWIAFGDVRLDTAAVPELMAADFVGGSRSHLVGVQAVSACERVEVDDTGASARCYWSDSERWAPMDEASAHDAAEAAFLETLDRRLATSSVPYCGLTGGYDSRVVAAASRELGYALPCFTWGTEAALDDPATIAGVLGLPYQRLEVQPDRAVEDNISYAETHFRWNEGLAPALPLGPPPWPDRITAFITGSGGETGRAFYYRLHARDRHAPSVDHLARVLRMEDQIRGASPEAVELVRARVREWVEEAHALHDGWRALDVLYVDQRMRRWGRQMFPFSLPAVGAFYTPEISRALVSLPLEDRLSAGFHRRFLAARFPEIEPPPEGSQRLGVPPVVRRILGRSRARAMNRKADALRTPIDWSTRSAVREWYVDALDHPVFVEALGARWARDTREAFLGGNPRALTFACRAVALAGLDRQLGGLRTDTVAPAGLVQQSATY